MGTFHGFSSSNQRLGVWSPKAAVSSERADLITWPTYRRLCRALLQRVHTGGAGVVIKGRERFAVGDQVRVAMRNKELVFDVCLWCAPAVWLNKDRWKGHACFYAFLFWNCKQIIKIVIEVMIFEEQKIELNWTEEYSVTLTSGAFSIRWTGPLWCTEL